jgi:hypothetical protein
MRLTATVVLGVAVVSGVFAPAVARAATPCPLPAGAAPELGRFDGEARLAWIDARLAQTAHKAQVWTWGWGIGIGAATVANLAPLPFVAVDQRIDWYTAAATTVIGIVPLLIAPLDVVEDSRKLRLRLAAAGSASGAEVCALLSDAEGLLVRDAKNQADGQRWWLHVGNVVLNLGVGLFLGIGFHHWEAGAFNFVTGAAIGEAIILTQPTASIGDLRDYRRGMLGYAGAF